MILRRRAAGTRRLRAAANPRDQVWSRLMVAYGLSTILPASVPAFCSVFSSWSL